MLAYQKALDEVCRGNHDAARFLYDITEVLHLWDDVVDQDHELSPALVNRTMWKALIDLPRNQFYATNFITLNTILMAAIVNWEVANEMEQGGVDDNDTVIAFIIRSTYVELVTAVALIIGGREHAIDCTLRFRRLCHDEGLAGYKENLALEQKARKERNGM